MGSLRLVAITLALCVVGTSSSSFARVIKGEVVQSSLTAQDTLQYINKKLTENGSSWADIEQIGVSLPKKGLLTIFTIFNNSDFERIEIDVDLEKTNAFIFKYTTEKRGWELRIDCADKLCLRVDQKDRQGNHRRFGDTHVSVSHFVIVDPDAAQRIANALVHIKEIWQSTSSKEPF